MDRPITRRALPAVAVPFLFLSALSNRHPLNPCVSTHTLCNSIDPSASHRGLLLIALGVSTNTIRQRCGSWLRGQPTIRPPIPTFQQPRIPQPPQTTPRETRQNTVWHFKYRPLPSPLISARGNPRSHWTLCCLANSIRDPYALALLVSRRNSHNLPDGQGPYSIK